LAVPQREPLSAPLLGALLALAGFVAGWLVLAMEALAQAGAGALFGFSWQAFGFEPPLGLPLVRQSFQGSSSPWSSAIILLAGPVVASLVAAACHALAEGLRAPAWVRAVALEVFAIAWLRLPLLLLAAGVPGGRGPVAALYERLGEPESGRWAAIALGVVVLWGVAWLVAWRAVELGGEWLRTDGRGFRRRVVRLAAAYPVLLATAGFSFQRPLAPAAWLGAGLALVLGALTLRTR
jgi:hypothetical protein